MNVIQRSIVDLDWITSLLLLSLLLLGIGKYLFRHAFFDFLILPVNAKYITLNKKKNRLFQGFHIIISVFQIINLALFIYVARGLFLGEVSFTYSNYYMIILGVISLYFLIKIVLQVGNGYFFENFDLMGKVIFEKLTYFNYGGLIAFIGNILLIYIFPGSKAILYIVILLILAINCIGLVKILRNLQKLITSHTFYFILYLCTLEISPIAIIISYLNS